MRENREIRRPVKEEYGLIFDGSPTQPGHYTHECPQAFDIRSMTMEEKLELLPELLTLADFSKETTSEEASKQADPGASENKDMSDFATCSR